MISDVMDATRRVGLEVHMGKSKVMHNGKGAESRCSSIEVQGKKLDIVDAVEYLGRKHSFQKMHETELDHRISKAWGKFITQKSELCSKHYRLRDRLRLFESTVTATVLYGSGSWTMTAELERKLRSTQRKMLRWMMGGGRRKTVTGDEKVCEDSESDQTSDRDHEEELEDDEDNEELFNDGLETWVEWIQRTTQVAEESLKQAGIDDWVNGQMRR